MLCMINVHVYTWQILASHTENFKPVSLPLLGILTASEDGMLACLRLTLTFFIPYLFVDTLVKTHMGLVIMQAVLETLPYT